MATLVFNQSLIISFLFGEIYHQNVSSLRDYINFPVSASICRAPIILRGRMFPDEIMAKPSKRDLDRFYDYVAGRVSSGKKPRLKIPERFKDVITEIESTENA
jgi:hypothetical protein